MELLALGPVRAVVGGRPVDLGPPKQRALFALLLASADRPVAVDTITELLWAGEPPARASASLQAYVSRLRRLLEPDRAPGARPTVLVTVAPGYLLRTEDATVDVREFTGLAARGRAALGAGAFGRALESLDAAAALWRGDAYADLRDADWIRPELARLTELRLSAAEDRVAALIGLGREAEAIADLDAHVLGHPLRERGWQLLARALYQAGRQGDALSVLRSARARLVEELGVDPGPELRRLEEAVLRQDPELDRPVPVPAAVAGRAVGRRAATDSRPFVGRADALVALHAAAAELVAGRGGVVLVDGEPGIGKTRLVERFVDDVRVPVVWGRCPDHEVAPALWPWEQVLRAIPGGPPTSEVAALLDGEADGPAAANGGSDPGPGVWTPVAGGPGAPGAHGEVPPPEIAGLLFQPTTRVAPSGAFGAPAGAGRLGGGFDPAGARLRLYEAVTAHLAAAGPLVVVLDDLHWADGASLRLLVHVAQAGVPVLVVGTFRRHEASGLSDALAALARVGARRVHVDGLRPEEVRALIGALAGADPGADRAAELGARSGGNPFFLGELARLTGTGPLPAAVRDVVLRRVAQLPEPVAALLGTAAVAGLEFDAASLTEVAGHDAEAGLDLLDIALAAGVLVEDGDRLGTLRFAHALIPDALAGQHSRLRRARLHRRFGEVTARRWAGRPDRAGEVARHWLAAADLDAATAAAAVQYAAIAARAAESRLAHEDAAGFWQEALAAAELAGLPDRFELLLGLTRAQHAAGELTDGLAVLDQVLAAAGDDPQRVVRAAVTVFGSSLWYPFPYGSRPALLAALAAVAPYPVTDQGEYALTLAVLAAVSNHVGELAAAAPLAATAAERARSIGDPELLARVLHLGMAATNNADAEPDCWALAAELAALPGAPPELAASARIVVCSGHLATGRIAEAHAELDALAPVLAALRSPLLILQAGAQRAALLALHGELDAAERLWLDLLAESRTSPAGLVPSWLTLRIDLAWQRGTLADLEPDLAGAMGATGIPGFAAGWALALVAAGRPEQAVRLLREQVPPPLRDYTWLHTTIGRLAVAVAVGDQEWIAELRAELLPFRDRLASSGTGVAIFGSVLGHLGEAALALGDVDTARVELTGALVVLDRIGAPYWAGRARQALDKAQRQADVKHPASPSGEAVPNS